MNIVIGSEFPRGREKARMQVWVYFSHWPGQLSVLLATSLLRALGSVAVEQVALFLLFVSLSVSADEL